MVRVTECVGDYDYVRLNGRCLGELGAWAWDGGCWHIPGLLAPVDAKGFVNCDGRGGIWLLEVCHCAVLLLQCMTAVRMLVAAGDDWIDKLVQVAAWKLPVFTPQGLANLLWGLARLSAEISDEILADLLAEAVRQSGSFRAADHANVLWALAKMDAEYASRGEQMPGRSAANTLKQLP